MNIISRYLIVVLGIVLGISCVKEPTTTTTEIEQRSLKAWIEKYHPELADNYQEEGGFYVEVIDRGVADSAAITGQNVWVWYDMTTRDLQGNICETRDYKLAKQLATYNNHARYIPLYRFSGKDSTMMTTMMEGTFLATFNKLKIGEEELEVRYGTQLRLYLPSTITSSSSGSAADGGYEGQYSLDSSKPAIVDMTIYGHVTNPVAYEGDHIEAFANANGGLCTEHKAVVEDEESAEKSARRRLLATRADESEEDNEEANKRTLEFYDGRWHQPIDTLEHLLVNYTFSPEKNFDYNVVSTDNLMYDRDGASENAYTSGDIYSASDIDSRINAALIERFGKGLTVDEVLEADSLKTKASVNVWYVGRFLDGFVFDTNIDEVKEIVFGEVKTKGEALTFETADPLKNKYILAWNYALPTLRLGQWATILTVSTYAYGISGQAGSHTTTTTDDTSAIDMANYYNYMSYMNNMYGGYGYGYGGYGGYGNMYNMGYYGYNPYYYGYNYSSSSSTTVTTTSTEIPSYSPLIFQVFVEK